MPSCIWSRIESGFSLRGLSLVKIAMSAPEIKELPISERFVVSLSPPHPSTAIIFPFVAPRTALRAAVTASGVCA